MKIIVVTFNLVFKLRIYLSHELLKATSFAWAGSGFKPSAHYVHFM